MMLKKLLTKVPQNSESNSCTDPFVRFLVAMTLKLALPCRRDCCEDVDMLFALVCTLVICLLFSIGLHLIISLPGEPCCSRLAVADPVDGDGDGDVDGDGSMA